MEDILDSIRLLSSILILDQKISFLLDNWAKVEFLLVKSSGPLEILGACNFKYPMQDDHKY